VDEEYHRIRSLVIFTPKIVKLNKLRRPEWLVMLRVWWTWEIYTKL
jgi:hypothetical protein